LGLLTAGFPERAEKIFIELAKASLTVRLRHINCSRLTPDDIEAGCASLQRALELDPISNMPKMLRKKLLAN
jgi:hypothetical protein